MLNFQDGTGCARPRSYSERPEAISPRRRIGPGRFQGCANAAKARIQRAGLRESAWAGP
jgi:hypothetical protein